VTTSGGNNHHHHSHDKQHLPSNFTSFLSFASFSFFIFWGIHYRYTQGQTVGEGFDSVGAAVEPLVAAGITALKEH
jgi:hypothetical protein